MSDCKQAFYGDYESYCDNIAISFGISKLVVGFGFFGWKIQITLLCQYVLVVQQFNMAKILLGELQWRCSFRPALTLLNCWYYRASYILETFFFSKPICDLIRGSTIHREYSLVRQGRLPVTLHWMNPQY